jgi:hypothetical protein
MIGQMAVDVRSPVAEARGRTTDGQGAYFSTRAPTCGRAASTCLAALLRTAPYALMTVGRPEAAARASVTESRARATAGGAEVRPVRLELARHLRKQGVHHVADVARQEGVHRLVGELDRGPGDPGQLRDLLLDQRAAVGDHLWPDVWREQDLLKRGCHGSVLLLAAGRCPLHSARTFVAHVAVRHPSLDGERPATVYRFPSWFAALCDEPGHLTPHRASIPRGQYPSRPVSLAASITQRRLRVASCPWTLASGFPLVPADILLRSSP